MKKKLSQGFLISVEGVDGCGKSSFCELLNKELSSSFSVILTKEPGGTLLGKSLRNLLLHTESCWDTKAEFLLFAADRAQHFSELVLPALQNTMIVISDRMADSSLVYQGYVKKLPLSLLETINTWAMQYRLPDVTFFLDIDEETVFERMKHRNLPPDTFEKNKEEVTERIQGFRNLFSAKKNVFKLDAKLSQKEILQQALIHLYPLLDVLL